VPSFRKASMRAKGVYLWGVVLGGCLARGG
jgi:hypothetical protein